MRFPVITGIIRRRLLVNFRVDPPVLQAMLPGCFRPLLHEGAGIAGICLIRLENIRPRGFPAALGLDSENAAHRIAVEWDEGGERREGVYIPRRDTNSRLAALMGGRLFPGEQHRAAFEVADESGRVAVRVKSADGEVSLEVAGRETNALPPGSGFASLAEVSSFFEKGALGYSATRAGTRLDGMCLRTAHWAVRALDVESVRSSFFDDQARFPAGSVRFDCALLMRDIPHTWHAAPELAASPI